MSWSPMGTMLATLHRQGVRLWGGTSWSPVQKFAHPLVTLIDFSPNERYLVTWSSEPIVIPEGAPQGPQYLSHDDEGNSIAVWDIKTGNLLRTFPTISSPPLNGEEGSGSRKQQMPWPALKWSPDDRYVARVTPGQQISVYELPGMGLLDKKSIKIEGVVDFDWCPMGDKDREDAAKDAQTDGNSGKGKKRKENMLAYWSPEMGNQPARVSLMSIPSRTVLRSKNLFNVSEVCTGYLQSHSHSVPRTLALLGLGPSAKTAKLMEATHCSANCIGKTRAISCASRLIDTPRPKSQPSVISKSSA